MFQSHPVYMPRRTGYRRRPSRTRSVIQSYKKVLNFAPASHAAGAQAIFTLTNGVDSIAAGQTSVADGNIPTGSVVKFIEIQFSTVNLISVASFMHLTIQQVHSGQSAIAGNAVGGNPQRNQVFHQEMLSLGQDQNNNRKVRFMIPKKFQRVREGDRWQWTVTCDTIWTDALQVIYKFYR